jgi:hypothetical protein
MVASIPQSLRGYTDTSAFHAANPKSLILFSFAASSSASPE